MSAVEGSVPRTRAPELHGRGWLNTEAPLRLRDLRGRFVLLDFWTFCCINCLHVIEELREVEAKHREDLVVIGVHSPKFVHEADPVALEQAVRRYHVEHPVLDDPELRTWQAYAARAWPTLVLIDPDGYVIAQYAGEGHAHAIDALITARAASYSIEGGPVLGAQAQGDDTALFFPAKAVRVRDRVLVADAGNDRIARVEGELGDPGSPQRGAVTPVVTGLRQPNGLCLLPADVAANVGYDLVVADTGHHRLVGVDSRRLGSPASTAEPVVIADGLNSPWDVAWWRDRLWLAMAGDHTLVTVDPRTGAAEHVGGTANEGLLDGPLAEAWFAQPSGLAPDGDRLWIADAETSALRWVEEGPEGLRVQTAVGEGLFDFGLRDGPREVARMQHPLGVAVHEGRVLVADTYNGAVRSYDPETGELTTVAQGLSEPSGFLLGDGDGGVIVVESAAHRLTGITLDEQHVDGTVATTQRPVTEVAAGAVRLEVSFAPPPGQKVDERFGPAVQLHVSATPEALLREGSGVDTALSRTLIIDPAVGDGVLHVAARAATCDETYGEGAVCRLHQQDWGIPVRVGDGGLATIVLPLGGTP